MNSPMNVGLAILSDLAEAVQKLLEIPARWRQRKIDQKKSETELEASERASEHEAFLQEVEKYLAVYKVARSQTETTMVIHNSMLEVHATVNDHFQRYGHSENVNAAADAIFANLVKIAKSGCIVARLSITDLETVPQGLMDQIRRSSYPELPGPGAKGSDSALPPNGLGGTAGEG